MIETMLSHSGQADSPDHRTQKLLKMVKNERMGGFVPSWETPKTAQEKIESRLGQAGQAVPLSQSDNSLTYRAIDQHGNRSGDAEFGFADLLDMVNPLHHVPVVSHIYRAITGDEIKPIGKIMGGAIYGGPIGAASGLVNVVIEEETGNDLAGNAMALAFGDDGESQNPAEVIDLNAPPEERIEAALASLEEDTEMTRALLSFSDLGQHRDIVIERGKAVSYSNALSAHIEANRPVVERESLPPREPITQISFANSPDIPTSNVEHKKSGLYGL